METPSSPSSFSGQLLLSSSSEIKWSTKMTGSSCATSEGSALVGHSSSWFFNIWRVNDTTCSRKPWNQWIVATMVFNWRSFNISFFLAGIEPSFFVQSPDNARRKRITCWRLSAQLPINHVFSIYHFGIGFWQMRFLCIVILVHGLKQNVEWQCVDLVLQNSQVKNVGSNHCTLNAHKLAQNCC